MEGYDFEAAASTVNMNIEDITSDGINRDILRRLKENDPTFDGVIVRACAGRVMTAVIYLKVLMSWDG